MISKLVGFILAVIFLLSIASAVYFYTQYTNTQKLLKNPASADKQEALALAEKIGKLMELPKNEEPSVATISDLSKLKSQEFFAKAKIGDKLLVYTGKKEAILYRPSTNKIINVAPITISNTQQTPSGAPSPTAAALPTPTTQPFPTFTPIPTVSPTQ